MLLFILLVLKLGKSQVKQLELSEIVICYLTNNLQWLVWVLHSFFSKVSCFNLCQDFDNIFIVFTRKSLFHNQIGDVEKDEVALIDDTFLFDGCHEINEHLMALLPFDILCLLQLLKILELNRLVAPFRQLTQEIIDDLTLFDVLSIIVTIDIILVNTIKQQLLVHVE